MEKQIENPVHVNNEPALKGQREYIGMPADYTLE